MGETSRGRSVHLYGANRPGGESSRGQNVLGRTVQGRNVQEAKRPGRGRNVLGAKPPKRQGGETSSYWLYVSIHTPAAVHMNHTPALSLPCITRRIDTIDDRSHWRRLDLEKQSTVTLVALIPMLHTGIHSRVWVICEVRVARW